MTTTTTADPRDLKSLTEYLKTVPLRMRRSTLTAMESSLPEDASSRLKYRWSLWARPGQMEPDDPWHIWLLLAGRGFGKTRTGAEWVRARAEPVAALYEQGRVHHVGEFTHLEDQMCGWTP